MLRFDRVSLRYRKRGNVLTDLSLTVQPGDRIVIAGRSGSGKTTLLRLAAGLLEPSAGEIEYDGAWPVGFVRQQPENQLIAGSVREEIAFSLEYAQLTSDAIQQRVAEILELTGLTDLADRAPAQLSGGQMQRVAVAAALASSPPLWLLDEPTAYLDPRGRQYVHDLFRNLPDDSAALLVAADASEYELGDRLLLIGEGRLLAEGTPEEVFATGLLEQSGLGLPRRLLLTMPEAQFGATHLPEERSEPEDTVSSVRGSDPDTLDVVATGVTASRRGFLGEATEALHDVEFTASRGEVIALVGPAGAGKTSLLEVLAGTLKPDAGSVRWNGKSPKELKGQIGIAFQFPERSFFAESVLAEVAYGAINRGLSREEAEALALVSLTRLGLPTDEAFLGRSPFQLAGGEARRVALAAVATMEPIGWLLDEPTAGLDELDAQLVGALVREEAEKGHLVIIAGHDVDRFADWSERWVVLDEGRVRYDGDPRTVWTGGGLPGYDREPETVNAWREAGRDVARMPALDLITVHRALHSRSEERRGT